MSVFVHDAPPAAGGIDPVTLEVIRHRLQAAIDEAEKNLQRTAFSTIVREHKDYCVGMVTAKGETIAQSRGSIPTFCADLGNPILDGVAMHGEDGIHEGDILLNNWAGVCGQHLNNVVMYSPVFWDRRIVAYAALRTHWWDVGGNGGDNGSTDIYQEGLQFRNVKIYKRGVLDADLERIVRWNVRWPDAVFGDLEAQVASTLLIKRYFEELLARYGWDTVERAMHACWDQSERYIRAQIRAMPNGRYYAEGYMDGDGITDETIPLRVWVIIEDEDITIDLSEMPPQVQGPYNAGATGGGGSAARVAFKGAVSPFTLPNEGEFRPLRIVTKPGTILSAYADAPMNAWNIPTKSTIDTILKAFAPALPHRISGGSNAGSAGVSAAGRDPRTRVQWRAGTGPLGGWGGFFGSDGQSSMMTTSHGDSPRNPVEVSETESPAMVRRFELVPDSGGPGRWRGGLGTMCEVIVPQAAVASIKLDHSKNPPWGVFGGKDGAPSRGEIARPGEPAITKNMVRRVPIPPGTALRSWNNGGGGYGDPLERDLAALAWDLRQGYVTADGAVRDYGAVLDVAGGLDAEATRRRRERLRLASTGNPPSV